MKRIAVLLLVAGIGLDLAPAAEAARVTRRTVVKKTAKNRTVVVVNRGWPLRRALPLVVARPPRVAVRVAPAVYLAPVLWRPVVVPRPSGDALVWEDGETLTRDDDWTEVTLNANSRGTRLFLEIASGKAQLNFAEVVFENGEARIVDFQESTRGQGLYPVLDFRDGRAVDHVRLVARAKADPTRLVLRMQK